MHVDRSSKFLVQQHNEHLKFVVPPSCSDFFNFQNSIQNRLPQRMLSKLMKAFGNKKSNRIKLPNKI